MLAHTTRAAARPLVRVSLRALSSQGPPEGRGAGAGRPSMARGGRRPERGGPPRAPTGPPTTTGLEAEAGSVVWEGEEDIRDPRVLGFGWIDDAAKDEIFECYMHDPTRFSVARLARIFGLREVSARRPLSLDPAPRSSSARPF